MSQPVSLHCKFIDTWAWYFWAVDG